jgi:hypothetical protein
MNRVVTMKPHRQPVRGAADFDHLDNRQRRHIERFEPVLIVPEGPVFAGERAMIDEAERPLFNPQLFGSRPPTEVVFDLVNADGIDLPRLLIKRRKARPRDGDLAVGWQARFQPFTGSLGQH